MKRKLSPAAKKAISQAAKKRWRTYRKAKQNGDSRPVNPRTSAINTTTIGSSDRISTIDRLGVLLDRFDGTPFEMSREQFTERAINWALDKLGN